MANEFYMETVRTTTIKTDGSVELMSIAGYSDDGDGWLKDWEDFELRVNGERKLKSSYVFCNETYEEMVRNNVDYSTALRTIARRFQMQVW